MSNGFNGSMSGNNGNSGLLCSCSNVGFPQKKKDVWCSS